MADAGESQLAWDGRVLTLGARAFGGTPPYAFAWSHAEMTRFSDAASPTSTFATAGLADGAHALTLTVTDALGATASDTVLHLVTTPVVIHEADGQVLPGLVSTEAFVVPVGTRQIVATLDWADDLMDLDLYVANPAGARVNSAQGATAAKPETVRVDNPSAATWTAEIEGFPVAAADYHLVVKAVADGNLPVVNPMDKYQWGTLDAQLVPADTRGGEAPVAKAWDLDLDGVYETTGEDVVASLPPGERTVAFKMVDARGFEARRTTLVTQRTDVEHVLRLGCGGYHDRPLVAMEYGESAGRCWYHLGHQTYFLGDQPYVMRTGFGRVVSVEQQFSGSTQLNGTRSTVQVETSYDGVTWRTAAQLPYAILGTNTRQVIDFQSIPANDTPFRFLRFAEPRAVNGLSGYLDLSYAVLHVDEAEVQDVPTFAATRALTCGADLFEDFFADHPCTFGGVDRWDSPSALHTYHVGQGTAASSLNGTVEILPWRTDDFFGLDDPASFEGADVWVQTSADGATFTTQHVFFAPYGERTSFNASFDGHVPARFVRFIAEPHPGWADPDPANDPLHHRLAFFTWSDVTVSGHVAT